MKALVAQDYGPPQKLTVAEIEQPTPGPGQVLLRVRAASVNPFDLKLVTGMLKNVMPLRFPYVPGMDVAGTVSAVGPDVNRFKVGDEVFGMLRETPGSIAEYAVANATSPLLAARPQGLEPVKAAALPEVGLTAVTMLGAAALQAGETVLVLGASGGVGSALVQLASQAGGRVIATARPEHADYVRGLGATEVIDHTSVNVVEEARRRHPGGVDLLFDLVSFGEALLATGRAVRDGGRIVSPLAGPDQTDHGRDLHVTHIYLAAEPGALDELGARVVKGDLKVEVSATYGLDRAAQALADLADTHKRGKLVVTVT